MAKNDRTEGAPTGAAPGAGAGPGSDPAVSESIMYAPPRAPSAPFRSLLAAFAVLLAAAGWYFSWTLLLVSAGQPPSGLLAPLCGAGNSCADVLNSPAANVTIIPDPNFPKLPVSALGLGYFAFVGLWYLFIGAPSRRGRHWHLLILAVVLIGAWWSFAYFRIMQTQLHRWCGGCLAVHALNGVLLLITLAVWPWRRPRSEPAGAARALSYPSYPSARLALATTTAGGFALGAHLAFAALVIFSNVATRVSTTYNELVTDPAFARWDFERQPAVDLPLYPDEVFGGQPDAPNTLVVFGDFECPRCRDLHELLIGVAQRHPDRVRVAFRHYPQDPECNPNPSFKAGGHRGACRAARAAEAVRVVGGREKYLALRSRLWENHAALPRRPYDQQSPAERAFFENLAGELGLDRAAFAAAMDSPEVRQRIQADVAVAERLKAVDLPAVFLNGKRIRGWHKPETWDALLGEVPPQTAPATQPTTAPAAAPQPR